MSDPKLKAAMAEITAVLQRLDIAGHVVLHNAPGSLEVFTRLDPTYSKLTGIPPLVRLRSKLTDYRGDVEAQRRDLAATANMVRGIAESMGLNAVSLLELADVIDAKIGAEHGPMQSDNGEPTH